MNKSAYYIGTGELADHIRQRGLDCTKNSRELLRELGDLLQCAIPMKTLVLAACFAGFAVIPQNGGKTFIFCKVTD